MASRPLQPGSAPCGIQQSSNAGRKTAPAEVPVVTSLRYSLEPRHFPSLISSQQNTSYQTSISVNELQEQCWYMAIQSMGKRGKCIFEFQCWTDKKNEFKDNVLNWYESLGLLYRESHNTVLILLLT